MTQTFSLAGALERALIQTANDGRDLVPVSLTLDYGVGGDPAEVTIAARVDRATRSLVFAHGEALLPDGRRAASASAVFRVRGA
jgi:acyl-coenzyme A thioesterase PaaI-like protein